MENKIGVMQGRLSNPINNEIQAFPAKEWKKEFSKAEKIGYDLIEWVFDSLENPSLIFGVSDGYGSVLSFETIDKNLQNKAIEWVIKNKINS